MKDTSIEAYIANINSGNSTLQAVLIYKYIQDNPKLTRLELSDKIGIPINAVCGRVNELLSVNLLVECGKKLQYTGRSAYMLKVQV